MNTPLSWDFPYPSQRMPVFARNVVATSQPLAAQAGLLALHAGGNAVDAALATAITLTVVEPNNNAMGGDAFALVWDGETLHGLNGSGRSPLALTPERFAGMTKMPIRGWDAVTVPGAVDLWVTLSRRFGKLPFPALFDAAIRYAREGFLVTPKVAAAWSTAPETFTDFPEFQRAFLIDGRTPRTGERMRFSEMARSLELVAATEGEALYRGELAQRIAAHARETGGLLTEDDLAAHATEWVRPISVEYHGYRVHEIPPNGQGLAALIALGLLRHHDLRQYPVDSADSIHLQIEAMKIAFAEAHRHIADPAYMETPTEALLDDAFLAERAAEIRLDRAGTPGPRIPLNHGTVYLTAADAQGMMVSFIQSTYYGFGSGIVVPGTGINLQDRGACFRLEPGHPNRVGPRKKPYHTIIPGFLTTADGHPVMSFGVMGGHMQPQGHVQMTVRVVDYGQNPQAAADAPRWQVDEHLNPLLEPGFPEEIIADLRRRGHVLPAPTPGSAFGGAQLIYRLEDGYCAASDPRKDGQAVGY